MSFYLMSVATLRVFLGKARFLLSLTSSQLGWPTLLIGTLGCTYLAVGQQQPVKRKLPVVGNWTFCATRWVSSKKDTTVMTGYSCTEVVFEATGVGYARLEGDKKRVFMWQQQETALTITYRGAANATRLRGGVYRMKIVSIPPQRGDPRYTQLELTTAQHETHLLMKVTL
jgi:hypothetical protein